MPPAGGRGIFSSRYARRRRASDARLCASRGSPVGTRSRSTRSIAPGCFDAAISARCRSHISAIVSVGRYRFLASPPNTLRAKISAVAAPRIELRPAVLLAPSSIDRTAVATRSRVCADFRAVIVSTLAGILPPNLRHTPIPARALRYRPRTGPTIGMLLAFGRPGIPSDDITSIAAATSASLDACPPAPTPAAMSAASAFATTP